MFQDAASIADIIGAVGVMISLVFVGLQVAQSNKLARNAARREQIEATGRISNMLAENAQLADVWTRVNAGQDVTVSERTQLVAYLSVVERIQEGLYWQYLDGQIDPELWQAHRRQARAAQNFPVVWGTWEIRRNFFSERYQKFRDEETAKVGDDRMRYDAVPVAATDAANSPMEPPKP